MKLYECFLSLFGGITVFITAMNIMSSNLQKIAGSKVKKILAKKASNILIYAGIGTIIAMVIQSSTAVTVMSIGFVNADMINLAQATTVILGANFGSSIIGILASLDSLNINIYFSFISFVGIVLTFFNKEKLKIIGGIISGLGMIYIGLNLMKTSCSDDSFKNAGYEIFCVGDDIAWLKIGNDGRLWAINPENGVFGACSGVNDKNNKNAFRTGLKNTIFTNVVHNLDDNTVWWEGMNDNPPDNADDWLGEPWDSSCDHSGAHPNSRFAAPLSNCPCLSSESENPDGVPISAILLGSCISQLINLNTSVQTLFT